MSRGLLFVDQELGGTVPFDIYLQFSPFESIEEEDDFFMSSADDYPERYWFDRQKMDRLVEVQQRLASEPAVGKLISLATLESVAADLNEDKLSSAEIAYLVGALPESIRREMIDPYAKPELGLLRISGRAIEFHETYQPFEITARLQDIADEGEGVVLTGL